MFYTNLSLTVITTRDAELGRIIAVDEHDREVIITDNADGMVFDGIDISDIYSENDFEWGRLVNDRIEEYARDFRFEATISDTMHGLRGRIRTSDGQIAYELA